MVAGVAFEPRLSQEAFEFYDLGQQFALIPPILPHLFERFTQVGQPFALLLDFCQGHAQPVGLFGLGPRQATACTKSLYQVPHH